MAAEAHARVAGPADADDVTRLMLAWRDHHGQTWPDAAVWHTGVRRLLEEPQTTFLLAQTGDDRAAGVALLRFKWGLWRDGWDCWLEDIFVDAAARGSGLGRVLMQAMLDVGAARDVRRYELDTTEDNVAARALYASFGFANRASPSSPRTLFYHLHVDP